MKALAAVMLVLAALPAAAQVASPRREATSDLETISVSGTGKSTLAPDRVTFTIGVRTVASTVDAATNQNNERLTRVLAALKAGGAREKDIQTSGFSIWPQQDHRQGALPQIVGYQVSNAVTVRSDKVADAGRLLQAAVNAGVNNSSGLQFEVSDPAKGRDEGLRAAFADARAKALLLAQAAGRTLGRTLNISEQSVPPPIPYPRATAMRAEASASEVPVASGTQEITYTVWAVFELR